jgi:hypothetical protein
MSLPLWSTSGGDEPFVFVFTMIVITFGAVLLANSNLIDMIYGLYSTMISKDTITYPVKPPYIQALSSFVLIGLTTALPIVATVFFYTARTEPYLPVKNYRDTMWITFLWLFASASIFMASAIVAENTIEETSDNPKLLGWKTYIMRGIARGPYPKVVQILVYLILPATVIIGMSVNLIEIEPDNIGNPETIFFILDGILLLLYMLASFTRTVKSEDALRTIYDRVLQHSTKLVLNSTNNDNIVPGRFVELKPKPGSDELHIVPSDSDARLALEAAGRVLQTSPPEKVAIFNSGYNILAIKNAENQTDYYMTSKDGAQICETAFNITPNARAHVTDFDPPVLKTGALADTKLGRVVDRRFKQLQEIDFRKFNGSFDKDEHFFGVARGHFFKMIMEEDTILLYSFYMLIIWMLTLRCSGTAAQFWTIVFLPPLLYSIAPYYRTHSVKSPATMPQVDRRNQWVYVQMIWGTVSMSMLGLVYKVFPNLFNSGFYITRPVIWQFEESNDVFWWSGDSGGFSYFTIRTVTLLQLAIFSYFAFISMAIILELALWWKSPA